MKTQDAELRERFCGQSTLAKEVLQFFDTSNAIAMAFQSLAQIVLIIYGKICRSARLRSRTFEIIANDDATDSTAQRTHASPQTYPTYMLIPQ